MIACDIVGIGKHQWVHVNVAVAIGVINIVDNHGVILDHHLPIRSRLEGPYYVMGDNSTILKAGHRHPNIGIVHPGIVLYPEPAFAVNDTHCIRIDWIAQVDNRAACDSELFPRGHFDSATTTHVAVHQRVGQY